MSNIKKISEYYGDGFSTLPKMIHAVTHYMNKDYHIELFEKFAKKAKDLNLKSFKKSIELAKIEIKKIFIGDLARTILCKRTWKV